MNYEPDRRFKPWLYVVTRNALTDAWRKNQKIKVVGDRSLGEVSTSEDFTEHVVETLLYVQAVDNLRTGKRVTPRDLEIFEMLTEQAREPVDVAEKLGISRNAVDNAKHRVLTALRQEIKRLS